jgi:hypothetical protein
MYINDMDFEMSADLRYGAVEGLCDNGDETFGSITTGDDQMNGHQSDAILYKGIT